MEYHLRLFHLEEYLQTTTLNNDKPLIWFWNKQPEFMFHRYSNQTMLSYDCHMLPTWELLSWKFYNTGRLRHVTCTADTLVSVGDQSFSELKTTSLHVYTPLKLNICVNCNILSLYKPYHMCTVYNYYSSHTVTFSEPFGPWGRLSCKFQRYELPSPKNKRQSLEGDSKKVYDLLPTPKC